MERFLQYLDDLDDLFGMFGLIGEHLRRLLVSVFSCVCVASGAIFGVALALAHPPLALATSTLLLVWLLYRSATSPVTNTIQTA
jgi:hypothetical protein